MLSPEVLAQISASQQAQEVSSQLSANNPIIAKIQALNMKEQASKAVLSAAELVNNTVDSTVSAIYNTIQPILDQFKKIPPKLKKAVDVQGATAGIYSKVNEAQKSVQSTANNIIISAEVPITSADYYANPMEYPKLLTIQYAKNCITDEDCLSSGYTKVEQKVNQVWLQNFKSQLGLPVEDRDVVEKQMEKLFNVTVKTTWDTVQPAVSTVGNLASIDVIADMVKGLTNAIDGIVKVISVKVDEKALDQKLAQQDVAKAAGKSEAEKAKSLKSSIGQSFESACSAAGDTFDAAATEATGAITAATSSAKDAFKQLKMPEMPSDIKETFTELQDAIIMVKDNISNIYIVLLMKLVGQVLDCFNQIVGVIGVPSIPSPLGQLPQLIADAQKVFQFVMGLPVSFVNTTKSIVKKKVKAIQVSQLPTPPKPVQTKVPVPPTSQDVQVPSMEWKDVIQKLVDTYGYKQKVAGKIVKDIQEFFDGSDEDYPVIYTTWYEDSKVLSGKEDKVRVLRNQKRVLVTADVCYSTWLASHVNEQAGVGSERVSEIVVPHKGEYDSKWFYNWTSSGTKEYYDASKDFGEHAYWSSDEG